MMKKIAVLSLLAFTVAAVAVADDFAARLSQGGAAVLRQASRARALGPLAAAEGQTSFERLASLFNEANDDLKAEDAIGVFIGRLVWARQPDLPMSALLIATAVDGGPALGLRMQPRMLESALYSDYESFTKVKLKEIADRVSSSTAFVVTNASQSEIAFKRDEMKHILRKKGNYLIIKMTYADVVHYSYFFKKVNLE